MPSAVSELELELASGERLLWSGKPLSGIRFDGRDLLLIPFGLVWLAFSIGWEWMALRMPMVSGGPLRPIFLLFGLPFILIGIYLAIGRYFFDARKRGQTAYGITDRRILLISRGWRRDVRSVELNQITEVQLTERRDGSGKIFFAAGGLPAYGKVGREQSFPITAGVAFDFVPRVREAYDAVQKARRSGQAG